MSVWLNTKIVIKRNLTKIRPCHKCGYCPYGGIVEEFPLKMKSKLSCKTFGHDCPMYYNAEEITE